MGRPILTDVTPRQPEPWGSYSNGTGAAAVLDVEVMGWRFSQPLVRSLVIGGVPCPAPRVIGSDRIICSGLLVPPEWPSADVVANFDKDWNGYPVVATLAAVLAPYPPPTVDSVDLGSAKPVLGGTTVTVRGRGFGAKASSFAGVWIRGVLAPGCEWVSPLVATFVLPAGSGINIPVEVRTASGLSSLGTGAGGGGNADDNEDDFGDDGDPDGSAVVIPDPSALLSYDPPRLESVFPGRLMARATDVQMKLCGTNMALRTADIDRVTIAGSACHANPISGAGSGIRNATEAGVVPGEEGKCFMCILDRVPSLLIPDSTLHPEVSIASQEAAVTSGLVRVEQVPEITGISQHSSTPTGTGINAGLGSGLGSRVPTLGGTAFRVTMRGVTVPVIDIAELYVCGTKLPRNGSSAAL